MGRLKVQVSSLFRGTVDFDEFEFQTKEMNVVKNSDVSRAIARNER